MNHPEPVIANRSEFLCRFFHFVFANELKKNFQSLRLLNGPAEISDKKTPILCINHPSWNDPMVISFLHYYFYPDHHAYGPVDADAFERYGFMKKTGFYPVSSGNAGGARKFLRSSKAIISQPKSCIWITAQGTFVDQRTRPANILPGPGTLMELYSDSAETIPIAIEYSFWNEKRPEIFANFGSPVQAPISSEESWTSKIENALIMAQDELAEKVIARDPAAFTTILEGKTGVGGIYQSWQHLLSILQGKSYNPSHDSIRNTRSTK